MSGRWQGLPPAAPHEPSGQTQQHNTAPPQPRLPCLEVGLRLVSHRAGRLPLPCRLEERKLGAVLVHRGLVVHAVAHLVLQQRAQGGGACQGSCQQGACLQAAAPDCDAPDARRQRPAVQRCSSRGSMRRQLQCSAQQSTSLPQTCPWPGPAAHQPWGPAASSR